MLARKLRYALTGQYDLSEPSFQPGKVLGAPHVEWLPQPGMFFFQDPHGWSAAMAAEFQRFATEVRSGRRKPTHLFDHHTISFSPDDRAKFMRGSEQLDPMAIVREALWEGAFCDRPHAIIMHHDTSHLNAHIYLSTCDVWGNLYRWSKDYRDFEFMMEVTELTFGLTRVHARSVMAKSDPSRWPGIRARTSNEFEMTERTGQKSARVQLQQQLDGALDCRTFTEFADSCVARGIGVSLFRVGDVIRGVTYYRGTEVMKASDLGVKYGWPSLHTKFEIDLKNVNHCRDVARLEQIAHDIQATPCRLIMKRTAGIGIKGIARYRLNKLNKVKTNQGIQYRWPRNDAPAFTDGGREILLHSKTKTTVAQALKHVINKGWTELITEGTQAMKSLVSAVWAKVRPRQKENQIAIQTEANSLEEARTEVSTGIQRLMALGKKPTRKSNNPTRSAIRVPEKRADVPFAESSAVARHSGCETAPEPDPQFDAGNRTRPPKP